VLSLKRIGGKVFLIFVVKERKEFAQERGVIKCLRQRHLTRESIVVVVALQEKYADLIENWEYKNSPFSDVRKLRGRAS